MQDLRFEVESWFKASQAVNEEAQSFASQAKAEMATLGNVDAVGCNGNGTLADAALAMILPALTDAINQTIDGLSRGLGGEASMIQATGEDYQATEETNAQAADEILGEIGTGV